MEIGRFICENRYKLFKTFLVYLTFFCIGSSLTLLGSSLLDLQIRLSVDFAKVSYLIPFRSGGHIIGSAVAGLIGQRFGLPLVLCICNVISGIFLGVAPNFFQFEYTAGFLLIAGIFHGIADVYTWKDKCTNWLQVLHMSEGIGSLFTPILCRPFLTPEEDETNIQRSINETLTTLLIVPISTKLTASDVRVQYAFMVIGTISVLVSFPFGYIYLIERSHCNKNSTKQINADMRQKWSSWKVYGGSALVAVISHLVYSLESVIGSLGASFSVKSDLHMDKKTGVLLATVFWSCFSFYRLIFIPLTFIMSEAKLLSINILITFLGVVICVPWANTNQICIWIGFTLLGIGLSPIFSSSYGMLARHAVITSKISPIIFIPGVIGESGHPAFVATLMAENPISFLYYVGLLGILLVITFGLLIVYCKIVYKTPHNFDRGIKKKISTLSISGH